MSSNSNSGFIPNNVHNIANANYNNNPSSSSSSGEPDLASYLRIFQQQQQQQQLNTSDLSLEPTPINQLGLLHLQRTLGGQQQQQQQQQTIPNLSVQQSLSTSLQAPQAIANMGTALTSIPGSMKGPVAATKATDARRPNSSVFGRGMTERQQ